MVLVLCLIETNKDIKKTRHIAKHVYTEESANVAWIKRAYIRHAGYYTHDEHNCTHLRVALTHIEWIFKFFWSKCVCFEFPCSSDQLDGIL